MIFNVVRMQIIVHGEPVDVVLGVVHAFYVAVVMLGQLASADDNHANLTAFAVVPATFRLSEVTRINVNVGWQWDRTLDRHYLSYGVGFD